MSFFFILNNLHFTVEVLGVLVFFLVSWLAFDAWRIRSDFLTASRGVGFMFMAGGALVHAVSLEGDLMLYTGGVLYIFGLLFVVLNMIMEAPVARPEFKAGVLLPAFSGVVLGFGSLHLLGHAAVAFLAFRQYKKEFKKMLVPFWLGFMGLTLSSAVSFYAKTDLFNAYWILEHLFKLLGFAGISVWVWQYLRTRIKEELLIIFVGFSLFMAVIISLTFSSILINRIENSVMLNLRTDVKVLDYAMRNLGMRSTAEAELATRYSGLADMIIKNKFEELTSFSQDFKRGRNLDILSVVNSEGDILVREGNVILSKENIFYDSSFKSALEGRVAFSVGKGGGEPFNSVQGRDFSIRAYAPVFGVPAPKRVSGTPPVVGVVIAGFNLDNAFVDDVKKITGLDSSIFEKDMRTATTLFSPDGRRRLIGMQETDKTVLEKVFKEGSSVAGRTVINSRPAIAAFLPIKNAGGETVGMIASSRYEQEVFKTAESTNHITLLITVIIMVILTLPIYFITKRLGEEV